MTHQIRQAIRSLRPTPAQAALLFSALALGGCGNVTAGGVGEADVYMTGDANPPPSSAPAPSRAAPAGAPESAGALGAVIVGGLEGDLDVTASLFLRTAGGTVVPLTTGTVSVLLDLGGSIEPRVVAASVPAGAYDALTVRFTEVTADVTGGLEIGGLPFTGLVEVALGPSLDVTRPLTLVIDDAESVELLVDLNSSVWVPLLDIVTHLVSAGDFAGAVTVGLR